MEPAFSARVGEVYLVSGCRTLTVAYAVSGTLVYLPSPRHRERAGRIQKDVEMNYLCSFLCLAKTAVFFRCLNMLLLRIIWRTAALWQENNSNLWGSKIAFLLRDLNRHLLGITLEHSRYLRWLKTVSSAYIWMGRYNHSLSLDATIMVSKCYPIIGEHVGIIFLTQ